MEENKTEAQEEVNEQSADMSGSPELVEIKPKKMSKSKIISLIIFLVIIWFIAVQFMAAERYDMQVQVKAEKNIMGINPLGESLDFGDLSHNLGATRFVTLKNDSDKDRYIIIWKRGEIADMVVINKNNFTLVPGQEEKLEFNIQIPPSAETRIYEGKVMVFKWPKFW